MLRPDVHDCAACALGPRGRCAFARKAVAAGTVVVEQGAAPSTVAFVRSGTLALSTVTADGEQTWAALRGPRTLVGAEAMQGAASACEVRALTDVELCAAPPSAVQGLLADPTHARALFQLMVTELLEQRRDAGFQSGPIDARAAKVLLALGAPLPRVRIAALLGIRPETLSRVLRRLTARGLIDGRTLAVRDRAGLMRVAGG